MLLDILSQLYSHQAPPTRLLPPGSSHQAPPSDRQLSRRLCFLTSSLPNNPIKEKRALKIKALLHPHIRLSPQSLPLKEAQRLGGRLSPNC